VGVSAFSMPAISEAFGVKLKWVLGMYWSALAYSFCC
jgi:hypothetical protein